VDGETFVNDTGRRSALRTWDYSRLTNNQGSIQGGNQLLTHLDNSPSTNDAGVSFRTTHPFHTLPIQRTNSVRGMSPSLKIGGSLLTQKGMNVELEWGKCNLFPVQSARDCLSICRNLGRGVTTGGVRIGPVSIKDHKEVEINMLHSTFYELNLFSPKALNELIN
jgi:hypothetical protein